MAGRLRESRLRLGIGAELRSKKRWCGRQHEKTHDTFHSISPKDRKIPRGNIETQDRQKVAMDYLEEPMNN
jgi:hypothetical protein